MLSNVRPRVTCVDGSAIGSLMSGRGFGIVVTTHRGSVPARRPRIRLCQESVNWNEASSVHPRGVMLRTSQERGFLGRICVVDNPIRPGEFAFRGVIDRAEPGVRPGENAIRSLHHDIADVGHSTAHNRVPPALAQSCLLIACSLIHSAPTLVLPHPRPARHSHAYHMPGSC